MRSRRTPGRAEDNETLEEQLCEGLEGHLHGRRPGLGRVNAYLWQVQETRRYGRSDTHLP